MATTEKLRNKLMGKLTELFQLDQPDLDFGFYRIMLRQGTGRPDRLNRTLTKGLRAIQNS